jgi:hypothetical protein
MHSKKCSNWSEVLQLLTEITVNLHISKRIKGSVTKLRLHNNLYDSRNIIRVIKSRSMSKAGHVARTTDEKCMKNFGWKT